MNTERFECPKCGTTREIESIGHAVSVPCEKCGKPMRRITLERKEASGRG